MKTVKMKMTLLFGVLMTVICVGLAASSFITAENALINKTKNSIKSLSYQAAKSVDAKLSNYLNIMEALTYSELFLNPQASEEYEKNITEFLKKEAALGGYIHMAFAGDDGNALYEDGSYAELKDKDYFKQALSGERIVTAPMFSGSNELVMIYAVPVKSDNDVIGVLIGVRDGFELGNLAGEAADGKTGSAFVINASGNTIAHANKDMMQNLLNSLSINSQQSKGEGVDSVSSATTTESTENADITKGPEVSPGAEGQNLLGYSNFSNLQSAMAEGKAGYGEYEYEGTRKILGYAPIESLGWSIGLEINREEALSGINELTINFVLIGSIFFGIALVIVYMVARQMAKPIEHLTSISYQMSNGDYSVEPEEKYTRRKDEMGRLALAFRAITDATKILLQNNVDISKQISDSSQKLDYMIQQFTKMMKEISLAVDQIANGNLEQAENTQRGAYRMSEMEKLIEQGQLNMLGLHNSSDKVEQLKEEGFVILDDLVKKTEASSKLTKEINEEFAETNKSAAKISDISLKIGNITKQTKLLALNASIEAARAGESGKGFAIVAKEVESLTEQTNKLSAEINEIVDELSIKSTSSIQKMDQIEGTTAQQAKSVEMTQSKFKGIAEAIEVTRTNMDTLNISINEMSNEKNEVVKIMTDLSATSEENASGTEEVSASVHEQSEYLGQIASLSSLLNEMSEQLKEHIKRYKF
ncbi:MAG: methyl-accepting chemotaxis protein [Mobilitalea sp.]